MTYFVKLLGSSKWPMPDDPWNRDEEMHTEVRFPPKPPPTDVARGDEFIYYAVGGTKCIFGASRAEGDPVLNSKHSNPEVARLWPWAVPIRLREGACVPRLSVAPLLESVAPGLQDNIGHGVSHFEIGHSEFTKALRLLERAKQAAAKQGLHGPRVSQFKPALPPR
jgi:hypothetical protein